MGPIHLQIRSQRLDRVGGASSSMTHTHYIDGVCPISQLSPDYQSDNISGGDYTLTLCAVACNEVVQNKKRNPKWY